MKSFGLCLRNAKEGFPNYATNRGTRLSGVYVTTERLPLYLVEIAIPLAGEYTWTGAHAFWAKCLRLMTTRFAAMDNLERIAQLDGYQHIILTPLYRPRD